ncbi:MAG: phosphonopyruvate decarboxylase [Oscillibacter sp.]|nr:phosphonopyruvate decarboxylase [Oscillibacter sp.]
MIVEKLVEIIGSNFYTGVPDSHLKPLCDYLMNAYGIHPKHHLIAANEGNCVALAAGYHLATGKIPVVYLQNSGEGNIINPVASLLHEKVYAIPMIFIIGWRGEPGVSDEPQHIFQGEVTLRLLEDMGISSYVIGKDTAEAQLSAKMTEFREQLSAGRSVAFVIRKNSLTYDQKATYGNGNELTREEIIHRVVSVSGEDPIISTTGKASRELFEIREANRQGHQYDFLTVGSMGHNSSIALGVALQKPDSRIWCIDGDGAALMHMGAMAVIGANAPENLIHVVINNGAHETVGGMPTVANQINFVSIAKACGYMRAVCAHNAAELDRELHAAKAARGLFFLEVKCGIGARENLGRPTTSALDNKRAFERYLKTIR